MADPVGALRVELSANAAAFERAMAKARGVAQQTGKGLQAFGDRVSGIGLGMTKFVSGPLVAFGAGILKAGTDFQSAMATIRTDTGATGAALDGLGRDLRQALATGPEDVETVAQALAALNTRVGLTGEPLQRLTRQMLDLADVTRNDVNQVVASTTRVFGDWSIATDDQARALDFLFRTTQQTGVDLTRLSNLVVQFGAPLRQLGFTFEQAAALMGKFEKEGVNVETVMSGLRIGLANIAKTGATDIPAAFRATVESIQNAATAGEATGIAMEVFGQRSGADLAAAIREGRFGIDDLVAALQGSTDTIAAADAASETFGEQMRQLRNSILAAAAPLGLSLLRAFEELRPSIERAIGFLARAIDAFVALPAPVQKAGLIIAGVFAVAGPVLLAIGVFAKVLGGLLIATGPIGLFIAAAALIITAWTLWGDQITALITRVAERITAIFTSLKESILAPVRAITEGISGLWQGLSDRLVGRSIVPEMIDAIIAQFSRAMVAIGQSVQATVGFVQRGFQFMSQTTVQTLTQYAQLVSSLLGKIFGESKAFALANAIVFTALGVSRALGEHPFPLNIVIAALIAAAGAVEIATITGAKFAEGGIVTAPTMGLVGEAGPEAIMPLSQLGKFLPDVGDGVQRIFVVLNERVIAKAMVRGMPREIRVQAGVRA